MSILNVDRNNLMLLDLSQMRDSRHFSALPMPHLLLSKEMLYIVQGIFSKFPFHKQQCSFTFTAWAMLKNALSLSSVKDQAALDYFYPQFHVKNGSFQSKLKEPVIEMVSSTSLKLLMEAR
jgi:hypothetical protein